jgi:hypothetical protein
MPLFMNFREEVAFSETHLQVIETVCIRTGSQRRVEDAQSGRRGYLEPLSSTRKGNKHRRPRLNATPRPPTVKTETPHETREVAV